MSPHLALPCLNMFPIGGGFEIEARKNLTGRERKTSHFSSKGINLLRAKCSRKSWRRIMSAFMHQGRTPTSSFIYGKTHCLELILQKTFFFSLGENIFAYWLSWHLYIEGSVLGQSYHLHTLSSHYFWHCLILMTRKE